MRNGNYRSLTNILPESYEIRELILYQVLYHAHIQYVMWTNSGSQGASFVPADCQVKVFGSPGFADRSSGCLSVRTIPLYGFIYRLSRYIPFYYQ